MNHEITARHNVLDNNGKILEAGYSKVPILDFNRQDFKGPRSRLKEWDYLLVCSEDCGCAFTISDMGFCLMASVSYLDFNTCTEVTKSELLLPRKQFFMPLDSESGSVQFVGRDLQIQYDVQGSRRHLYCLYEHFYKKSRFMADIWFEEFSRESLNILTPWSDGKHFYFNRKHNCLKAEGRIAFNYKMHYFKPDKDLAVLDWGRGWWPYSIHWYWGTGSGYVDKKPFGFNLGYGFGDTSASSENMLFYDGKAHKLDEIELHIPKNPMSAWTITSSDGRFEGTFVPDLDRKAKMNYGLVYSNQHQYFGLFTGKAVLDDGKVIALKDFRCAFEDITNRY
jgi:hypothetical protein